MEPNEANPGLVNDNNLFLTTPFKGKNAFWRYFVLSVAPFIASNTIGAIPLAVVILMNSGAGVISVEGGMPDFASMGIDLNLGFALTVFPFILAFFTFVLLVRPINNRNLGTVINGGRRFRWGRVIISALIWTALAALWLFYSMKRDPSSYVLNNTSGSIATLAILAVLFIPFQAGFEEILFRGYLTQGFAVLARNRWVPILVTSTMFGLMHGLNPEVSEYGFFTMMPQYIFFGLTFSVLTMMDDGIELAIGAHTANNIFLSVFLTNSDSALQTPAMYEQVTIHPWYEFLGLILMSVIFIAIMAILFRWKDVSRLYGKVIKPEPLETQIQIP